MVQFFREMINDPDDSHESFFFILFVERKLQEMRRQVCHHETQ